MEALLISNEASCSKLALSVISCCYRTVIACGETTIGRGSILNSRLMLRSTRQLLLQYRLTSDRLLLFASK